MAPVAPNPVLTWNCPKPFGASTHRVQAVPSIIATGIAGNKRTMKINQTDWTQCSSSKLNVRESGKPRK